MLAQASPAALNIAWIVIAAIVLAFVVARIVARRRERGGDGDGAAAPRADTATVPQSRRGSNLAVVPLTPGARTRYAAEWKTLQKNFVDAPGETIAQADRLAENIMRDRGFPVDDFDARTGDFGEVYAPVVDDYRTAHMVALRNRKGAADTESLRQAMVAYGALVEHLLERAAP